MINKAVFEIFKESVSAVLPVNAVKDSLNVTKGMLSIQGKTYHLKKSTSRVIFSMQRFVCLIYFC